MMPRSLTITFSIAMFTVATLAPVQAHAMDHGSRIVETAFAVPEKVSRKARKSDQKQIQQLEEDWSKALLSGDTAVLSPMIAADFTSISANGAISDRQQYLEHFANKQYIFRKIEVQESKIRILKNVAIVTTLANVDASLNGHSHMGLFRYTRVYHVENGAWRVVNFEATRVSGTGPGDMSRGRPLPKKEN